MILTPDELRALLGAAYHDGIAAQDAKHTADEEARRAAWTKEYKAAEAMIFAKAGFLSEADSERRRLARQLIITAHVICQNPALKRRAAGDLAQLEHAAKRLEAAMKGTP
jgi:hypothetical protein